ncbi:MAG TPA: alpha/beta hydrolase [Thermomicrobiales bacterium]|jgi:pimeloyl-ACP methyl ester carboxylesterase
MTGTPPKTGYAPVNGLNLYYEIHGAGHPLVLLHGAFMTIEALGDLVPSLARTRQIVAPELQGHGHTADIDRPLNYRQMADDVAALIRYLGIDQADVFGYSMGGAAAIQLAIRHPELVRKLVAASASYNSDGFHPGVLEAIAKLTPDVFIGTPPHDAYLRAAPNPGDFPKLVEKITHFDGEVQDWSADDIRGIKAPTMIVIGDSDGAQPEHAVEMFRLRGGGVMGDLAGLPPARLAVFPGTTHVGVIDRVEWLSSMVPEFLDAPMPEAG